VTWRPRPSHVVIGGGLGVILVGGLLVLAPMFDAARWQSSPEATRAERNADAPTPIWLAPTAVPTLAAAVPILATVTQATTQPAQPPPEIVAAPTAEPVLSRPVGLAANIVPQPTPTPQASDLQLASSAFVFDDSPEPGAHAHLDLTVHNPTDTAAGPLSVALPASWLRGYRLESASPGLVSGTQSGADLQLGFNGPAAGADLEVSISFVTTDEVIDSPALTVYDAETRLVGRAHPPTQAPPARPGPIYSIDIPRLKLHAGVVPVEWEPPLFVVGQVRTSAWVTRGNSVLVGHVRGAPGYNVFINLDQLQPGDEIVANSRGQAYNFVVSRTEVLPEDDTSPTEASSAAQLTLMTCAGDWNPITRDYPDRLWVVAEQKAHDDDAGGQTTDAANASTPNG